MREALILVESKFTITKIEKIPTELLLFLPVYDTIMWVIVSKRRLLCLTYGTGDIQVASINSPLGLEN